MNDTVEDAGLLDPISPELPCGPDLDAEGDPDFMNFMAATEGMLPATFFSFERKSLDFPATFAGGAKLLERTHDLRLIVLLAKLSILDRDIDRFAHWLAVSARLLADHWDEVHPRGEDGDFIARTSQLSTLDDGPVVVLPMQYAALAETSREGILNFRAQMVAIGEAKPRESENLPNAGAIEKILLNAEMPELAAKLKSLQQIKSSLAQIRAISIERAGFEQAVSFEALAPLVNRMTDFIQAAVAQRDPNVAPPAPAAGDEPAPGGAQATAPSTFATLVEVDAALGAALRYFELSEPSSAAVPLIAQARHLLGKNLYDVMKLLAPNYADNARIFVGAEAAFTVPVSSLAASEGSGEAMEKPQTEPAESRAAALALVDSVAAHLRRVEPSSPAPYLLDRAKALASRDFLSLLKELLSEDALSQLKTGG
jgi:type VI secretion system protein ImpA